MVWTDEAVATLFLHIKWCLKLERKFEFFKKKPHNVRTFDHLLHGKIDSEVEFQ